MFNQHLTHEERSNIASLKRNNCSNAEIAVSALAPLPLTP